MSILTIMTYTLAMRINQYLATQGIASRRAADGLVKAGLVMVNGKPAIPGQIIGGDDKVTVAKSVTSHKHRYYIYHKPVGVVTHSPLPGLFPVGRLDKNSSGLLVLTDDGLITDRLLHPDHEHEKEYKVTVTNNLRPSFKKHMEGGVDIGNYVTRPCRVKVLDDKTFSIILTEGKKHQIRRMCAALHNDVRTLARVRIMNLKLGDLAPGAYRELTESELTNLIPARQIHTAR